MAMFRGEGKICVSFMSSTKFKFKIIFLDYCQAPGPVQCPGQGPSQGPVSSPWSRYRYELRNSKFSVIFSKERTWRDTIIK